MAKVEITSTDGIVFEIKVDGVDVANAVTGFSVKYRAAGLAVVELELLADELIFDSDVVADVRRVTGAVLDERKRRDREAAAERRRLRPPASAPAMHFEVGR